MEKLSRKLARLAKTKGICQEWYNRLKNMDDKDAMLDMYLQGIDFCISNDYPTNEFIRANFKGSMEHKGIFLDDAIDVSNIPKCVCLGATTGCITVDDFSVCEIYAKHNSHIDVKAKGNAFVVIDIFDDSIVNVVASDRAKVCVNHYGGSVSEQSADDAMIRIRNKNKKTY